MYIRTSKPKYIRGIGRLCVSASIPVEQFPNVTPLDTTRKPTANQRPRTLQDVTKHQRAHAHKNNGWYMEALFSYSETKL